MNARFFTSLFKICVSLFLPGFLVETARAQSPDDNPYVICSGGDFVEVHDQQNGTLMIAERRQTDDSEQLVVIIEDGINGSVIIKEAGKTIHIKDKENGLKILIVEAEDHHQTEPLIAQNVCV